MSQITRTTNQPVPEKAYRSSASVSDAGTVDSGFFCLGILNTGSADAIFDGQTIPAGTAETYPFVGKAYAEPCTYDATGTTLLIKVIW
jgi:hypothetical protein